MLYFSLSDCSLSCNNPLEKVASTNNKLIKSFFCCCIRKGKQILLVQLCGDLAMQACPVGKEMY